jgi:hypothetical protein
MRRGLSVLTVVAASSLALALGAAAESPPPYDGLMSFPYIQGPDGPEEFSWAVKLDEEQELRAIDDTHAGVYYTGADEHPTFTITAALAHAADGANVPTTLAVTQPNVITLTVHHRAGNPAAGGAPFDYPVVAGMGYEGGFQQHTVVGPPPTEQATAPPVPDVCNVPHLSGMTVKAARRQLRRSHCTLGAVWGERSRGARVVKQFRKPGRELPAGTEVGVKLHSGSRKSGNELTP